MKKFLLVLGMGLTAFAADTVWVEKSDGARSCDKKSAIPLERHEALLKKQKIRVFQSRKGSDGKAHMQVCGATTGSMNQFEIKASDLSRAEKQGFHPLRNSQDD